MPSAISYTVRKLESHRHQLFLREGKQVELTAEGRYFLEHARDILRDLGALEADITQLHGGVEQQFRVGLNNLLNPAPRWPDSLPTCTSALPPAASPIAPRSTTACGTP